MKKLFAANMTIRTGDYEFDYPLAVEADTEEEATKKAQFFAKNFYYGGEESDLGEHMYEFDCGNVLTWIDYVHEVKNKEEWLKRFWNRFKLD